MEHLSRIQHGLDYIPKTRISRSLKFNRPSFIYLIRCEQFVKIGIADNPIKRVIEMQICNPFPLRLLFAWRTNNALASELFLHTLLEHKLHSGEWFKLSESEVCALIDEHPSLEEVPPEE